MRSSRRISCRYVALFARGERICEAGKTLTAARVSVTNVWQQRGHRSAADWLADTTGDTVGAAIGTLELGEQLDTLADTRDAFVSGRLSPSQAKEIAAAATADPHAERELLGGAAQENGSGTRRRARRVRAHAGDAAAREERIRRSRSLRTWNDADGAGCGQWRLPADQQARLLSAIEARQNEIFADARATAGANPPRRTPPTLSSTSAPAATPP
jgi:hypothetical protein